MLAKLNAAFVESVYAHVPDHSNPSLMLSQTLHVGREAAYRRLRGEVPFSFGEAAALSSRLNFSLDGAAGAVKAGNVHFRLKLANLQSPLETYDELLRRETRFYNEIACDSTARIATATNSIPAEFYLRYPTMTRFKLYKWLYLHDMTGVSERTFEEFALPERLSRSCREYVAGSELVPATYYVFDESCFRHWINAIKAFHAMLLISAQSVRKLREEMLLLVDRMERIAACGAFDNGNKVFFYLSGVDVESTCCYVSTARRKVAGIGLFSLNGLSTDDEAMYEHIRQWIGTQTRFSTLISRSGELQRIHFFRRQRKIIGELG